MEDRKFTGETNLRNIRSQQIQMANQQIQEVINSTVASGGNLESVEKTFSWEGDTLNFSYHLNFGGGSWGDYGSTILPDLTIGGSSGRVRQ